MTKWRTPSTKDLRSANALPRSQIDDRFQSILRLTADFYWETDADHRFTQMTYGPRYVTPRPSGSHLGKTRWEVPSTQPDAAGWAAHKAVLDAHLPFEDFEFTRPGGDCGERHYRISGEPVFDAHERFCGYRGIGRDITETKRSEQLLSFEHRVARLLADSSRGPDALKQIMRALCEIERWECGRYFRADEQSGVLRFEEYWCAPGSTVETFITKSRDVVYGLGVGVSGKAWLSGQPLWVADIHTDPRAQRLVFSVESGIHSVFAFPVKAEGKAVGVLVFSSCKIREPDERLLQAIVAIGSQIGQFLKRIDTEQALRENEELFHATFNQAAAGMAHVDTPGKFTLVNQRLCDMLGYTQEEIVGKTVAGLSHPEDAHVTDGLRRDLLTGKVTKFSVEKRYLHRNGSAVWVLLTVALVRGSDGAPKHEIAVFEDITARKQAEQLMRLEHTVARCLADADAVSPALKGVIRAACEIQGWTCGRYFRVDEEVLRLAEFWSVPGTVIDQAISESRDLVCGFGTGVLGEAWKFGQPAWSADIRTDPRVQNPVFSIKSGMHSVFAFPVNLGDKALGVLVFSSREIRQPDERLLQSAHVIGSQVGQFMKRKHAEDALRESEGRFRSLTQLSSDFFWETDTRHRFTGLVFGPRYSPSRQKHSSIGQTPWEIPSDNPNAAAWEELKACMDQHDPFQDFEFARKTAEGAMRHFSVSGEPRFAADGAFLGYRGVGRDVTELVHARERIASLAYNDALTGLSNRTSLVPALERAVNLARRHGRTLAVVFLDLDGFKEVNDAYGHDTGDRLLIEVARRLRTCLRSEDLLARLGGDEFVAVLEQVTRLEDVETVAQKLLDVIVRPYTLLPDAELPISASIGISLLPDDAADSRTLMKHADIAMYLAKQSGKNCYRLYKCDRTESSGQSA